MQKLIWPILVLFLSVPAATASTLVFIQQATTQKRPGAAPQADPTPGMVIGAPSEEDRERAREVREQRDRERQLQRLFQEKVAEQQRGNEEASPDGGSDSPEPGQEQPSGVQPPSAGAAAPQQPARPQGPVREQMGATESGIKLNFSNAPIDRVVNSIMQELGYSYVIDPQVQGTVNIFTMREIPRSQLLGVLERLLKMNGQAIIKQEDFYVILPINQSPTIPHGITMKPSPTVVTPNPQEESETQEPEPETQESETQESEETAQQEQESGEAVSSEAGASPVPQVIEVPTSNGLEGQEGVITYIIPLHHIPSEQMLQMLQPFLSPGSTVVDFAPANMVLITDYRQNIEQALTIVDMLDTRYFDLNTIDLLPIRYNQAVDVAEDLATIFAPGDSAAGVRIVAIERLNSLLVVAHSPAVFQKVVEWVDKLDTPSSTSNLKTFVYQVENNTAVQIAQILAELYQDGLGLPSSETGDLEGREGQAGGSGSLSDQRGTPDRQASFVQQNSRFNQFGQQAGGSSPFGGARGGGGYGGGGAAQQLGPALSEASQSQIRAIFAGNVKIVVNEFNNSLVIQGTEADIQFILDTVRQLDTLPRQVVIEAKIYSVELRDDLSFGVSAFLQERGGSAGDDGSVGPATTASILADPAGQLSVATRAIVGDERELQAIINALRNKTNVEIVESPRILALDGTPASINVGAEVPVTSASFGNPLQSGNTNFVNSIQFRPTGTTLLIVPRISASGIVTMDLVLEVSSATGPALTPTINRNFIQSSFIVRDGQTIGIAGLISDSQTLARSRVPLLGDIPILGALFGTTTNDERRFELVIFITPKVIRSLPTSAELSLDFKRALRNAYDFIEQTEREEDQLIERRRQEELQRQLRQQEAETP